MGDLLLTSHFAQATIETLPCFPALLNSGVTLIITLNVLLCVLNQIKLSKPLIITVLDYLESFKHITSEVVN